MASLWEGEIWTQTDMLRGKTMGRDSGKTPWEDGGLKWCIYNTKNTKDASKPKARGREGFPYSFQREHGAADTQISEF